MDGNDFRLERNQSKYCRIPTGCNFDTKKIKDRCRENFDKAIRGPLKVMLLLKIVFLVNHQQPLWTISNSLDFFAGRKIPTATTCFISFMFPIEMRERFLTILAFVKSLWSPL